MAAAAQASVLGFDVWIVSRVCLSCSELSEKLTLVGYADSVDAQQTLNRFN